MLTFNSRASMQLKTLLNHVQPYKGFVHSGAKLCKSFGQTVFAEEAVVITIRARQGSKPLCGICENQCPGYDTLPERLFDYLPVWGVLVYFAYARRRVQCPDCGVRAEKIPWASGNSQITDTLAWHLASWAKEISWSRVGAKFKVSWDTVCTSVTKAVDWGLKNRKFEGVKSIGVDEIARAKGHKYLTLVYQIDKGNKRLLWIGDNRTIETFNVFFDWFGEKNCKQIEAVCSDMWKAYLKVIKERIPDAIHVLDRFHIAQHLNKSVDKVRAAEHRKLVADGYESILFKKRWLLLRKRSRLDEEQSCTLKKILKYNLKTLRAYLLKEDFDQLWGYSSPVWAGKFLDKWCTKTMRSKIEEMKPMAKMIRRHRPLILNWFKAKGELSSGVVEGLNTKAKLTSRKSYGFKSPEMQKIALYHALGDLPVPEWTHKFA